MTQILASEINFGPYPDPLGGYFLSLEANSTDNSAVTMRMAAWEMVETFTRRHFRAVTSGRVVIRCADASTFRLPFWPFPEEVTVEARTPEGWVDASPVFYLPEIGELELSIHEVQKISFGPIPAPVIKPNVHQAAHNLALYLLVNDPARREFRSQNAGDSGFTREGMMGALYGSGAGALLAGEVRL